MYSTAFATMFLYIASLVSFLLGVQFEDYSKIAIGASLMFFAVGTIVLLVLMRKRMEKQNF